MPGANDNTRGYRDMPGVVRIDPAAMWRAYELLPAKLRRLSEQLPVPVDLEELYALYRKVGTERAFTIYCEAVQRRFPRWRYDERENHGRTTAKHRRLLERAARHRPGGAS